MEASKALAEKGTTMTAIKASDLIRVGIIAADGTTIGHWAGDSDRFSVRNAMYVVNNHEAPLPPGYEELDGVSQYEVTLVTGDDKITWRRTWIHADHIASTVERLDEACKRIPAFTVLAEGVVA